MDISNLKDMSIGKMIDSTIMIYKKNFKSLVLITLLLHIPMIIIFEILSDKTFSLRDFVSLAKNGNLEWVNKYNSNEMSTNQALAAIGLYLVNILNAFSFNIILNIAVISILHKTIKNAPIPKIWQLIKESLKKFWSVFLGNIISNVVFGVSYVVLFIIFVVIFLIIAFGVGVAGELSFQYENYSFIAGVIIAVVIFAFVAILLTVLCYFWIKFVFVNYSIVMENETVTSAISRSFKITKKHLNKIGIGYTFAGILYLIVTKSILATLEVINIFDFELFNIVYAGIMRPLVSIVGSIFYPFMILFLGVVFISLKVKNEAYDLEIKIDKFIENQEIEKSNAK